MTPDNVTYVTNQVNTVPYQRLMLLTSFFSEALTSRLSGWEMVSCSCSYVCLLTGDKTYLIGWDCERLAGNKWQLNEMLGVIFLHT
jgi:hypothetical protein